MGMNDRQQKSRKAPKSQPALEYGKYITYDLQAHDREWLHAADLQTEFPDSVLDDLVSSGYKYSLSPDPTHHRFIATLTDKDPTSPFAGYSMSGSGATPTAARYSLLYRHCYLAQGDWSFFETVGVGGDSNFS